MGTLTLEFSDGQVMAAIKDFLATLPPNQLKLFRNFRMSGITFPMFRMRSKRKLRRL
ncbi:MAG: hypothetical protein HQK57_14795 [Deltaproteobacteria bacterium]|nr:hypothetical protein [Deltaproteobacteria bacterium]